jgi:hypothetical protein
MLSRAIAMVVTASIMTASGFPVRPETSRAAGAGAAWASGPEVGISTIASDQLAEKPAHKDFFLVNVHVPHEGEIEQADAFIQFDKIAEDRVEGLSYQTMKSLSQIRGLPCIAIAKSAWPSPS